MKTLAIFPSIAIFLAILTLFRLGGNNKNIVAIIVSALGAGLFCFFYCVTVIYSGEIFMFALYGNFISVPIVISCLAYLTYSYLPKASDTFFWVKLIVIVVAAILVTGVVFATTSYFFLVNNPMHPAEHDFEK
jgi:hypothetical protein